MPKRRKCVKCGASLTEEDVMKIELEDGSSETVPFSVCPDCFARQLLESVDVREHPRRLQYIT